MGYTVAIVGTTGAVGHQMLNMLEKSSLPISSLRLLASARSVGKTLAFKGKDISIEETTETSFSDVDIAFFSGRRECFGNLCSVCCQSRGSCC